MLGALGENRIRTARAKAARQTQLIFRHTPGNGLVPIASLAAGAFPERRCRQPSRKASAPS